MLHIGIDDTDAIQGMCTTYLLTEVIRIVERHGLHTIGFPKLVRLNPNIPWKTRGNAALSLSAGAGAGTKTIYAELDGMPRVCYHRSAFGKNAVVDERTKHSIFMELCDLISRNACFQEENTNPGVVILEKRPEYKFYMRGVRDILKKEEIVAEIESLGGLYKEYKNGRGVIGAFCAIAWRPFRHTFEILTYRERQRWGTPRNIDPASVIEMDKKFKTTFNNYSYEESRIAIAPHTPCPILFGIRASAADELIDAMNTVRTDEKIERWCIFITNQATDDHIVKRKICACRPGESVRIKGIVNEDANVISGGHVIFTISDGTGKIDCTVYEPSKQLTRIAREIIKGDYVEVFGSVREYPRTVNVEKLHIVRAVEKKVKIENPVCPSCGKHMKSRGKSGGYVCHKCHTKAEAHDAKYRIIVRDALEGWYEPAVSSRRHLARPVKLMYNWVINTVP